MRRRWSVVVTVGLSLIVVLVDLTANVASTETWPRPLAVVSAHPWPSLIALVLLTAVGAAVEKRLDARAGTGDRAAGIAQYREDKRRRRSCRVCVGDADGVIDSG